jgi:hypothetical protein
VSAGSTGGMEQRKEHDRQLGPQVLCRRFKPIRLIQMILNSFQTNSNLIRSKQDLPELENFEIKYGFKEFDEGNNIT